MMNSENIFVVIEEYLNNPSKKLAARIKQLSHDLTNEAYEDAKLAFPNKYKKNNVNEPITDSRGNRIWAIGADEYGPILMDKIQAQAREAMEHSTRMTSNESYNAAVDTEDKPYIFKVSKAQQQAVNTIIGELLNQKGSGSLHPDGLIFAFDGYIERRPTSKFTWVSGKEAVAYDHNAKLYLKGKELVERGEDEAAEIVTSGCKQIKAELNSSKDQQQKFRNIEDNLVVIEENPKVQEHRGTLKVVLTNFMLLASGIGAVYLAATAEKRGSFFYRPNTDTENKIKDFKDDVMNEESKPEGPLR